MMTLTAATGTIQAGPEQQARLVEIVERLEGKEFYVSVSTTIPTKCIDGRPGGNGIAPNSAGGTLSLMVADDLTTKRFAGPGSTTLEAYMTTIRHLQGKSLPVGGHTDDHAGGEKSGCGANDRLPEIYETIATQGGTVRQLAETIGLSVDDTTHELIVGNAAARTEFAAASQLLDALISLSGDKAVDPLTGVHKEVAAVINFVPRTTLDRPALEAAFAGGYQAFNVDAWSFTRAAGAVSVDEAELGPKVVALAYYNLATALVLCGPHMPVIIRR